MHIFLTANAKTIAIEVIDYRIVATNPELILDKLQKLSDGTSEHQLFKVKFIAKCILGKDLPVVHAALYFDGSGLMSVHPLEVPDGYDYANDVNIYDYKSYFELTRLMDEEALSFKDYLKVAGQDTVFNWVVLDEALEEKKDF